MRALPLLVFVTFFGIDGACQGKNYFGFGVGIDHGGLGLRVDARPAEHLGLFGGVGWAFGGLGWNAGLHIPILTERAANPYVTAMYGYNFLYVVKHKGSGTGTLSDRDIYYGPSVGGGVEFALRNGDRLLQVGLLVPFRSEQVLKDHPSIENELWPILFSLGLKFKV